MFDINTLISRFSTDQALSIRQPWAWLIVNGRKNIENRNWYTRHRGTLLIHAARKYDYEGEAWILSRFGHILPDSHELLSGGIIGAVELVAVVTRSSSEWYSGPYGFLLKSPHTCPFVPLQGQLGIFNVNFPEINPFTHSRNRRY